MGKVKITANPQTGKVFTPSLDENGKQKLDKNGKAYGFIRLESAEISLAFGYNSAVKRRSALKAMTVEAFEAGKDLLVEGAELPGKIRVIESLENKPGYSAKTAGKDGIACTLGGKQIFRTTEYTEDMKAQDELIQHDNVIEGSSVATVVSNKGLNG